MTETNYGLTANTSGSFSSSGTVGGLTMPTNANLGNLSNTGNWDTSGTTASTASAGTPSSGSMSPWQMGALGGAALGSGIALFGGSSSTPAAMQTLESTASQEQGTAANLWNMYQTGTITAADQASIGQWEQGQKKAVSDYYAKAGLSNSSMAQEAIGQVGVHAQNMRQQANQSILQSALSASNLANSTTASVAQYQISQDQQKQQAQTSFLEAVGSIAAYAIF